MLLDLQTVGRSLVALGIVIAVLGLALALGGRVPLLGRLPGDVELRGHGWTVYAPIATSLVLSVLLTLVLGLVGWLGARR